MFRYKLFALLLGMFFCVCPFVGLSQLQVSVVLPMQMPAEISEWQTNPALVQIIITSLPGTPEFPSARCEFVLRNADNQQAVVSTKTNHPSLPRFPISAGPSTQIRFGRDIVQMNSLNINQEYQTNFLATNSLPEGNYEFCLEIYDDRSNQLIYSSTLQGICTPFIVVVPDPPSLILPADEDVILSTYPVFSWTPVMLGDGSPVRYNLKIVPLFEGQNTRFALDYNEVLAEVKDIQSNSYMYSPTERPFIHYPQAIGFAWQVQAVSLQGVPVTRNNGKSELFTFFLHKDTVTTTVIDEEKETEPDIVQPEYIPNKKRSIQFGEFWVTIANDIDCNSCILNIDGFAFLPFLNDSVRVTLVNVPITNVDKPYYVALSGEASNNFQFTTKTKNSVSVKLSSLKLTPNSAKVSVSTRINWQSFGWMNGEDVSQSTEVAITPKGFQYGITLDFPWKRNGNQIGLNSLFEATIDSIYSSISFSKVEVDATIVLCPAKNTASSTKIDFDCISTSIDLSANQASVLFENAMRPINIVTPTTTISSTSFAIDLSTTKAITNDKIGNDWRGIQLFESIGSLSVKPPFAPRFPMKVASTKVFVTPTSNSFVYSGTFGVDSLSCSYGGFPLIANKGSITLDNNQSSGEPFTGSISVLSASKPSNWTDLETIPVEILLDQGLQLQLRLGNKTNELSKIASLPLKFRGIDDTLTLNLSKGAINVQSESDATLTFISPIVTNESTNQQFPLDNVVFKSNSNTIEQIRSNANSSFGSDFSLQGALFSIQSSQFSYTSPKEYSLRLDGVLKGIGKKMPEKLTNVPFSELQLSTISHITSKNIPINFGFNNELRAIGNASIVQEQFGGKKFFGLKGNVQVSLQQPVYINDVKGTFYFGSLDAKPYWYVTNVTAPIATDEILSPSQTEQRSSYFSKYLATQSQQSSSKVSSIGSFEIEKLLFGIGSVENASANDDVQSALYLDAIHIVDTKTNHKFSSYIYSKNNVIQTVDGQLQLGQRGIFSIQSAKSEQLANRSHLSFVGEGSIGLSSKESSNAKVLIEHSNDETIITVSELTGTISVSSSFNEPLRTSNTDIHFDNATMVVSPYGLEAVNGVTVSSIYGTEGNEPSFIAIQKKPVSNLILDIASKDQFLVIVNVKGTIITSYDDDPCTQWGTLKGISPQGILANPGTQSVSSFSVGELSECGTPMSAYQHGNFSLCYSTMSNEFSCTTPLTISANNSVQSFSVGSCTNCTSFEQKITSSKKSLKNTKPTLISLEHNPHKGATEVDANIQPTFQYAVSNVQKPSNNSKKGNVSLEFGSESTSKFQFDSLSTEYYFVEHGKNTLLRSPEFSPCSQYQMRIFVYLRDKDSQQGLVLSDTISWSTAAISKTLLASQQLQYTVKNDVPTIAIVNRSGSSPIQLAQNFWKQHTLQKKSLVEKGVVLPVNSEEQRIQLPVPVQQKTEIVAIPLNQQCSQSPLLTTTAYPQLQDASFSMSSMNDNEVQVQFTNIPEGIEYTLTINSFCNNELQQIVSKQQYSPAQQLQKTSSQIVNVLSILGKKPNNCSTNGYTISVEFPAQFTLPTRCISIGTAPQCLSAKKE